MAPLKRSPDHFRLVVKSIKSIVGPKLLELMRKSVDCVDVLIRTVVSVIKQKLDVGFMPKIN